MSAPTRKMPRTRGECGGGPRPCPWIRCKYHLATKALVASRRLKLRVLPRSHDTCALDVADRGPHTLDEIGKLLGLTRERVRQIEAHALVHLRDSMEAIAEPGITAADEFEPIDAPPGNWASFDFEEGAHAD